MLNAPSTLKYAVGAQHHTGSLTAHKESIYLLFHWQLAVTP